MRFFKAIDHKRTLRMAVLWMSGVAVGMVIGTLIGDDSPNVSDDHPGHEDRVDTTWTCSMHPQVRKDEPGACPICGMDLIPLTQDKEKPGPKTVVLSERAKTLARIRTTPVERKEGSGTSLRLLGRIEQDETALRDVTAWTGGRIERLHVNSTGETVRAGQVIASLYSPEVFTAWQDLIVARRGRERMKDATEATQQAAQRAYEASRNRLRLLGVPKTVLDAMETQEAPGTRIAIRTPYAGTVVERVATEGGYVKTGALLYKVVDLEDVWVQLDAYESDLSRLNIGLKVRFTVEGIGEESFDGKIAFIDPTVDPGRRTARVRVEVNNENGRLRPGMFVEAEVEADAVNGAPAPLTIPQTSPLFTGRRAIVFVEEPDATRPTYTARTVRLGVKRGEDYPVIAGLSAGERVVTKGAFTLDADLQIRGGMSMMAGPDDRDRTGDVKMISLSPSEREKLAPVMTAYLALQTSLAADNFTEAAAAAQSLADTADGISIESPKAAIAEWPPLLDNIHNHAARLAEAKSMESARGVFETVSGHIIALLERLGNPASHPVRLAFCPMAFGSEGAFWVQEGDVVDNPYYGDAMRTCGEIRATVAVGAYLLPRAPSVSTPDAGEGGHRH